MTHSCIAVRLVALLSLGGLLSCAGAARHRIGIVDAPSTTELLTCSNDAGADQTETVLQRKGGTVGIGNQRLHALAIQAGSLPQGNPQVQFAVSLLRDDRAGVNVEPSWPPNTPITLPQLSRPALLTLSFAGCTIPAGKAAEDIVVALVNPADLSILGLASGPIVRPQEFTVSVLLPHFSAYGLAVP